MRVSVSLSYGFECDRCGVAWVEPDFAWEKDKPIGCPGCAHAEVLPTDPRFCYGLSLDTSRFNAAQSQPGNRFYERLSTGEIRSIPDGVVI